MSAKRDLEAGAAVVSFVKSAGRNQAPLLPNADTGSYRTAGTRARLLFAVNDSAFFVSHRLPVALAALRAGLEVHLTALDTGAVDVIRHHGIVYHPLPLDRTGTNLLRDAHSFIHLWRLVGQLRPTIIHLITIKPVIYGSLIARWRRVPALVCTISGLGLVFGEENEGRRTLRALVHRLYRVALAHPRARVIFQNPDDLAYFLDVGLLAPERAVLIRGSGVDMSVFAPRPEPLEPPVVILPARLLWAKGVGDFVEAARRLRAAGVEARFVLAGLPVIHHRAGVPQATIEAWAREGTIEWWGYRTDMPEVYAQSHIVCLPSYYREGVPRALIEAAACGRAIVTTDMPGCREVVRHGENGLLVPPRDPEALAAALREVIDDPTRRAAMGRAGRDRAVREFSIGRVVEQTMGVYREFATVASDSRSV